MRTLAPSWDNRIPASTGKWKGKTLVSLASYLPVVVGLVLVVVGVLAKDPTVRDVGIGFLGGGATAGGVERVQGSRVA